MKLQSIPASNSTQGCHSIQPPDAQIINVTFTRYKSKDALSKRYRIVDGAIQKTAAAQMSSGKAIRVAMPFDQFSAALASADERTAFGYGVHSLAGEAATLCTQSSGKNDPGKNRLARTKENFQYANGPGILMLDHDPSEYGETFTPAELLKILAGIHPELADTARIVRGSVSAGVHRVGEESASGKGFHIYFPVLNAADIPRYGVTLFNRLWMQGFGYIALSANGSMLTRAPIDAAVFSPERLDFVGAPIIGEGLTWTPPVSDYTPGAMLDTSTLFDLSEDDQFLADSCQSMAKDDAKAASAAKRGEWETYHIGEQVAQGIAPEVAQANIQRIASGAFQDLHDTFLLHFADMGAVTVAQVLNDPSAYNGKALADPVEGTRYGTTTAKFYWNEGKPFIHSFAHGESKYFLHSALPDVDDVTDDTANNGEDFGVTADNIDGVTAVTNAIPGDNDRPCYRVFDEWIKPAKGRKYQPGVWHFSLDKEGHPINRWISTPLYVDAVTFDGQDNNYGRLLRFKNTRGRWRKWAMPMELLRGSGDDLRGELLSMGVEIDTRSKNLLPQYLQSQHPDSQIHCALQVGWCNDSFVLPDTVIGPSAAGVIFQSGERAHDEHTKAGTLEGWQIEIAARALSNPLLVLALSAAFAGPVLRKCNMEGGGLHFVGDSSTGKTTLLEAACSVWGGTGYKRSWRATANGMEGAAALSNDYLLALDEISECDPREIGAITYSLGNGTGKQRAGRSGNARGVTRWRCFVLSSGERTIDTAMAEGGHKSKAGHAVRLLDIPTARTYGTWDNLHGMASGTAFSDAIKRASVTHYGFAGRAFLEKLTRETRDLCALLEQIKAMPEFSAAGGEGQDKRAAGRFAVLALAGELATAYGITGWPEGEATRAAALGFELWRSARGKGNDERRKILDAVSGFIERHGDSRFSNADNMEDMPTRERAGWWRDTHEGRVYLFNAAGLRDALKGFDFNRALDALQEAGALPAVGSNGERAQSTRIAGRVQKLYIIHADRLDGGTLGIAPAAHMATVTPIHGKAENIPSSAAEYARASNGY